ncbi:hypothetical protein GN244_ATG12813 [Phytophthora infestans]|uniref:Uncharacterized protein n=1 Tax=Phytophthora infestans TaxID=4787 RepID=A0A833WAN1_PHYIN|nr:hypothetical protein GN244_ATG12813 [Phytophthora infestans]KAF4134792.1 hypothetical protein GN958_ATG16048 [Phytophthora infestans]KAI9990903.1 hypothetical protein PInf_018520 [Phytophthora infestans]
MSLWRVAVLLVVVLTAASGQGDEVQSGCEVCASTGDCSRAYRGESGQFCGNWLDRQSDRRPCCCPDNAVCKVSNYACNCGYAPHHAGDGGYGLVWLWWLLGSLALLLCCCGCCFMASKQVRDRRPADGIPVAAPVAEGVSSQPYRTTSTAYASAPVDQGYADATPQYGRYHGQSTGGRGMGAGTGAALGGTAGLLGGVLLGNALADHGGDAGGREFDGGGFDGAGGGGYGGGGDFAGDF